MIEWYYRDSSCCKVGPLTATEFEVCVVVGEVRPETEVWRSDLADWTTYAALLAQQVEPSPISHSRRSARSPRSSSYRTQIALGISAIHQTPARALLATSGCTPWGVPDPRDRAGECESVSRGAPDPILDRRGADVIWLGRQFVRLALAGTAFVLVHFLVTERATPPADARVPIPSAPRVVLGPMDANGAMAALTSPAELALPSTR
jgi:hypothetical protein